MTPGLLACAVEMGERCGERRRRDSSFLREGTEVKSDFSEDSEVAIVPRVLCVESLAVAGS